MTFQSCRNSANKDLRLVYAILLSFPLLFASACGGGGGSTPPGSPSISSVSVSCTPTSVQTGQTSQCTATVSGTGSFSSGVTWSATDGAITLAGVFTPSAAGTATITATSTQDITKSGTASITVVAPSNPVPTITALSPPSLAVGATPQSLTINGTGFLSSSTVSFNAIAHTATYVSASQLTISLTSADLTTVGIYPVVVTNPAPGGGASSPVNFTVTSSSSSSSQWAWVGGSSTGGASGTYGSLGVPSGSNVPGERVGATSWTDGSGNLWLFGGYGVNQADVGGYLNDLWEYSPTAKTWTWVSGANTPNQTGVYGTQGIPATSNSPGARESAIGWMDGTGNLWLFGGVTNSTGNTWHFNDLWEFNPTAKTWTWVAGANTPNQTGVYGTQGTPATTSAPGARDSAVSWIDGRGDLWCFGGYGVDSTGNTGYLNDLWEFNPTAKTWTWVAGASTSNQSGVYGTQGTPATTNVPSARYQAASWIDSNGNLWLFGGYALDSKGNDDFFNDLWEFNPTAKTWTWVAGANTPNQTGVYGTQGTPASTNVPGARYSAVTWTDGNSNFWLFGGGTGSSQKSVFFSDLWEFNPTAKTWTWVNGPDMVNQPGGYGTQGTPAVTNIPGGRDFAVGWIDGGGNFWLFGGDGIDSTGLTWDLNDLWRFQSTIVPPTIDSVSVTCSPTSILTTQTSACSPTVTGTEGYSTSVTWSVSPTTMGSVSNAGVLTPSAAGVATITATSTKDPTKFGSATVAVSASSTISTVSVSCALASVPTGQTSQCSATVSGTGNYSSGVTWAVNGTSGGNATYGAITAGGLYQAPTTAPAAYIVTVSATSSSDSTKSGSFSVLIAGTIASVTQPITASAGGTISLPGGDSVTIPAGDLTGDSSVTLQLTSVATQPTNTLFGGIGPSLLMSFSPAVGGVGAAVNQSEPRPFAAASTSTSSGTSDITFVLQGGQALSGTQLQGALGVINVNDGNDNYFAAPSSYDPAQNLTTLQVDPSTMEGGSTLQIGLTLPLSNSLTNAGNADLYEWEESQLAFQVPESNFCPTGKHTLVLIHGMWSTVQQTFIYSDTQSNLNNSSNSWAVYANSAYTTIIGINYDWKADINTSAQSVAKILNSLFDSDPNVSPCKYQGSFDIEAHSEGTIVALAAAQTGSGYLSPSTELKLKHVVLVAGPIDGTPVASQPLNTITYYLNAGPPSLVSLGNLVPVAVSTFYPFIDGLQPNSSTIQAAQTAAKQNLASAEIIAVGGDKPQLDQWWETWLTEAVLQSTPNDGVIPVSSALPSDSTLPNLVRLVGNDPSTGDLPYPENHTHLVNDSHVMPDILDALNGAGETAQVTLGISPQNSTVLVNQSLGLTANATNILNPQINWDLQSASSDGTLSPLTETTAQYTAPQTPGGPFTVIATLPAIIPNTSVSALAASDQVFVNNPVPTITPPLVPASLPVGSASQTLTINGTGFVSSSTVTFNGANRTATLVSASELTINLTSSDLATVGTYPVVVTNPAPGGGSSTAVSFTVSPTNPVPAITSLAPTSLAVGATPQTLTINGTGFLTTSTVTFNGVAHSPTYVSASQLTISLTSADLATAGTYSVVVTNPATGGGPSSAASFTVTASSSGSGEWTWVSGSNIVDQAGAYGTLGTAGPANVPGSREEGVSWIDRNGNLWLFGGNAQQLFGSYNDLWEYEPANKEWTWISGSDTLNATGVYGLLGTPANANVPGSRFGSVSWIDSNGNLWLFGGTDSEGLGVYNDLWEYRPATTTWTWESGSNSTFATGVYGSQGTAANTNAPGARFGSVSWIDLSGSFWLFGGFGFDSAGNQGALNDLWKFDPTTKEWTWMNGAEALGANGTQPGIYGTRGVAAPANAPGGRYEAASWIDSNGNFWLFGGYGWDSQNDEEQLNDLWEFKPTSNQWAWISGSSVVGQPGVYGTLGVASSANVAGARAYAISWIDSNQNLWLFGGLGFDSNDALGMLNDLWTFNPASGEWTWMGGASAEGSAGYKSGIYGTLGVPSPSNFPGSRDVPIGWTDNSGGFWLFGGNGYDSNGSSGDLNDLWRYQPVNVTAPSISGVNPTTYLAPLYGQTMTINGSNFQSGATLTFVPQGGSPITSTPSNLTFHSGYQLSYQFNDSIFVGGAVGTWTVTITNPDGQNSNTWNFTMVCHLCEINP